ncbi:hypothetical protein RJ639_021415 [Escallonia herrerae]|uniref:Uncharacterized protein n=1 Tax=Escallonia herrerae TaxID=1293975 RepID=A0AA88V606_9ASTE|nr:hypothetical protein RJ639_021415 [Escallonia herrerae]
MGDKGDFSVKVSKREVVAAVLPTQEHWLPLSNLDLLLPPLDVGVFFFYKKQTLGHKSFTFESMASILKKSMAETLVSYYAFAGEVLQNTMGEPELLCNNRGVDFIEAIADVELRDLNLSNPDACVEGKLVPKKKSGVLSVQVTKLRCGGLVMGCTFDHRVADAYSANMFLVSWAEIAQSKPVTCVPSFRRSLLNPRHPGCFDQSADDFFMPVSALPLPNDESQSSASEDGLISRIYYVEADQLNRLQSLASSGKCRRTTKLEAFTAFLWKVVVPACSTSNKTCRMGIVVDGRARLEDDRNLMASYFGNVLSIPFSEKSFKELKESQLSSIADAVQEVLESAVKKEHFLGLIDWVEAHRPEPAMARIYGSRGQEEGTSLVVSSGQRFPVEKMNFGWGGPAFGSYHFQWGGEAGYIMPMPSPIGNGDWIVYMHMFKGQLELIETRAGHVFKPVTKEYLKL